MKIYDISIPLSPETPPFPGDTPVSVSPVSRISRGDAFNTSRLTLSTHSGTHLDPPRHFLEAGASMEAIPLEVLVGRAWVWEYRGEGGIGAEALAAAGIPEGTERLLIRTSNSQLWQRPGFQAGFVYLKPEAARWLVGRGVRLVGFDYLSVEEFGAKTATTHLTLLGAGVVILEGLDLSGIAEGEYTLVCLPLKVKDGDGAPARAVLIEE